jgi:hypothetical protein
MRSQLTRNISHNVENTAQTTSNKKSKQFRKLQKKVILDHTTTFMGMEF